MDDYDRAAQDVGGIVSLEHVNLLVPDQGMAISFYVSGLGLTRDPYLMVHTNNMWINVGKEQFHLITGPAQVLRGTVGLVVPDLDALAERLQGVVDKLAGSAFAFSREDGNRIAVTCPWGNRIRCHAPDPRFGRIALGIAYVELETAPGTATGIANFYERFFGAPVVRPSSEGDAVARVAIGGRQALVFRESGATLPPYDGHHIAIYVANFSGPHARLKERALITEESDPFQYRFVDIVDPDSGELLFALEHEVRSLTHPMFMRPLVNRNPEQGQRGYTPGRDAFV